MPSRIWKQVLILWCAFATPLFAAERVFDLTGVVRGKLQDGRPVIEHEEIPGYMMAMTMVFNVSDLAEVVNLREGDKVRFQFHVDENASYADQFVVVEAAAALSPKNAGSLKMHEPLKAGELVPLFKLTDATRSALTNESLHDRYSVITFMFTRCPVPEFCPLLATKFSSLQSELLLKPELSSQVRLLSITLDPAFDNPQVLAAYGDRVGANPEVWKFATGEESEIKKLTRAFKVTSKQSPGILDHSLSTALIGPDGRLIKIWTGNRWKPEQVMDEIRKSSTDESCCEDAECHK